MKHKTTRYNRKNSRAILLNEHKVKLKKISDIRIFQSDFKDHHQGLKVKSLVESLACHDPRYVAMRIDIFMQLLKSRSICPYRKPSS